MRRLLTLVIGVGLASAQTRDLGLAGDRFKPLKFEEMTAEQKTMVDHLLTGARKGLGGPFNVLLRSPIMGDAAQAFGAVGRFQGNFSRQVAETVIIMTGRYWTSQYEWQAHKAAALQAGVSPAIVDAIAAGKRPSGMSADLEVAYNFIDELFTTHQVSDARFAAAKEKFGEKGIVDMLGTAGWYSLVSMSLNVDRYPLGNGATGELKAMENPLPVVKVEEGRASRRFSGAGDSSAERRVFNILAVSPPLADTLRLFGAEVPRIPLAAKLREMAALLVASRWMAEPVWQEHRVAALATGWNTAAVQAMRDGRRPAGMKTDEAAAFDFCTELLTTRQVSDTAFAALRAQVGERGIVEILGAAGYYQVLSMVAAVDR